MIPSQALGIGVFVASCAGVPMEGDAIYFRERASEERAAAGKCDNLNARQSHLEMARRYDTRAKALEFPELKLVSAISR
jgi:hypothetical protein